MTDIKIAARDQGSFGAYVATPASGTGGPGVLVIQEIFGVNQVMRDLCDGFAKQGYIAMCPDLFWRQEPGIQITDKTEAEWAKAFSLYKGFDEAKGVADLVASLDALRKYPGCSGRVGTVGFCLGGKLAYLAAARGVGAASVAYYGVGIENSLQEADGILGPLMLNFGERDRYVPPAARAKIAVALEGKFQVESYTYESADHGFYTRGDPETIALARKRTNAFLNQALCACVAARPAP